jgi:adenylosuccinate synthase
MQDFVKEGRLNIVMDGQFGSTGKGAVAAFLAIHNNIDIAVTNAAPNAGHTYDLGAGKKTVFHLPVCGVLKPDSVIYIGAGAIIDPYVLEKELLDFRVDPERVFIHPAAAIIEPCDKEAEAVGSSTAKIASTQKGVGSALARKLRREGNIAANCPMPWFQKMVSVYPLMDHIQRGSRAIMEVPQGFSLGINAGFYPHCTSRDITVAQALSDARVHPAFLGNVMMTLRTYPIRVGNLIVDGVEVGNSGPVYDDQKELDWIEDLGMKPELTTVTKRPRRVFTFSTDQLVAALRMNRPNYLFLNFCNYLTGDDEWRRMMNSIIGAHRSEVGGELDWALGFGPSIFDVFTQEMWEKLTDTQRDALPWRTPAVACRA